MTPCPLSFFVNSSLKIFGISSFLTEIVIVFPKDCWKEKRKKKSSIILFWNVSAVSPCCVRLFRFEIRGTSNHVSLISCLISQLFGVTLITSLCWVRINRIFPKTSYLCFQSYHWCFLTIGKWRIMRRTLNRSFFFMPYKMWRKKTLKQLKVKKCGSVCDQ